MKEVQTRQHTLDVLARFVGYKNYEAFQTKSHLFVHETAKAPFRGQFDSDYLSTKGQKNHFVDDLEQIICQFLYTLFAVLFFQQTFKIIKLFLKISIAT